MVGSWWNRPAAACGSIWGIFRSNLEVAFFEEVSQNLRIFRSWTFTAGVVCMVSALICDLVCIHECILDGRYSIWWTLRFASVCANRGRDCDSWGMSLSSLVYRGVPGVHWSRVFLVMFVCIRSIVFGVSRFVRVLWVSWQAQYFPNVFCLLIWLKKSHFRHHRFATRIGCNWGLCVTGAIVILRFACHRLLRAMYWTFHVLRLSNMNVVSTVFCIPRVAPCYVLDISCVTTTKRECCSSIKALHPIASHHNQPHRTTTWHPAPPHYITSLHIRSHPL